MGKMVLVVDRSQDFLELMEMVLVDEGYAVVTCSDLESAFENARQFQPHVAIVDLAFPRQGGWDLIEKLRADSLTAQMHIVVCTAAASELTRRSALVRQMGLKVLPKPFDLTDLTQLLTTLRARCAKP